MSRAQISTEYVFMVAFLLLIVGIMFVFSMQTAQETISANLVANSLNSLEKTIGEVYALGPDTQLYTEIDLPDSLVDSTVSGYSYGFKVNSLSGESNLLTEAKAELVGTLPTTSGRHLVRVRMRSDGKIELGKGLRIAPVKQSVSLFPGQSASMDFVAFNETYDSLSVDELWVGHQYKQNNILVQLVDSGNTVLCDQCFQSTSLASPISIASGDDFAFTANVSIPTGTASTSRAGPNYLRASNGIEGEYDFTVTVLEELGDVDIDLSTPPISPAGNPSNKSTLYFADAFPPETLYLAGAQQEQRGQIVVNISALNQAGQPANIKQAIQLFQIIDPNGVVVVELTGLDIPFSYTYTTTLSSPVGTYTVHVETDPTKTKNAVTKDSTFELTAANISMRECFEFQWLNTAISSDGLRLNDWLMRNACTSDPINITQMAIDIQNDQDGVLIRNVYFGGIPVFGEATGAPPQSPPAPFPIVGANLQPPYSLPASTTISANNKLEVTHPALNDEGEVITFTFYFQDGSQAYVTVPPFSAPPMNDADCIAVDMSSTKFTGTLPAGSEFGGFTIANNCEKPVTIVSTMVSLAKDPNNATQIIKLNYLGSDAWTGSALPSQTIVHSPVVIPSKSSWTNHAITTSQQISVSGQSITLTFGFPSGPTYTSPAWQPNLNLQSVCLVISHGNQPLGTHQESWATTNDVVADFSLTNTCPFPIQVIGLMANANNNPTPTTLTLVHLDSGVVAMPQWQTGNPGTPMPFSPPSNPLNILSGATITSNDLQFNASLMPPFYLTGTVMMADNSQKSFPPWPQTNMTAANCLTGFSNGTWDTSGTTYTGTNLTNPCSTSITIQTITVNDGSGNAGWKATTVNFGGGATEYFDAAGTGSPASLDITDFTIQGNGSATGNSLAFSSSSSVECKTITVDFQLADSTGAVSVLPGISIAPSSNPACSGG
ncbi:MAG: hypothetical protein J4203_02870 [Candidatus Diapherotrites archaeon]|nr:hypothetical protein [Candidatus Diapherotrites archaeon]